MSGNTKLTSECVFLFRLAVLLAAAAATNQTTTTTTLVRYGPLARGYDLRSLLLSNYDKRHPPVNVSVKVGFSFNRVNEVSLLTSRLSVGAYYKLWWRDERLQWNASIFERPYVYFDFNADSMSETYLWTPDLELWNAEHSLSTTLLSKTRILVNSTGHCHMTLSGKIDALCIFGGLKNFPYGALRCTMELGSWHYDASRLDIHWHETEGLSLEARGLLSDQSGLGKYQDYKITRLESRRNVNNWLGKSYPTLLIDLWMNRAEGFYKEKLLWPYLLLGTFSLFPYWINPGKGQGRMGFGIGIMLAIAATDFFSMSVTPKCAEVLKITLVAWLSYAGALFCMMQSAVVTSLFYCQAAEWQELIPPCCRRRCFRSSELGRHIGLARGRSSVVFKDGQYVVQGEEAARETTEADADLKADVPKQAKQVRDDRPLRLRDMSEDSDSARTQPSNAEQHDSDQNRGIERPMVQTVSSPKPKLDSPARVHYSDPEAVSGLRQRQRVNSWQRTAAKLSQVRAAEGPLQVPPPPAPFCPAPEPPDVPPDVDRSRTMGSLGALKMSVRLRRQLYRRAFYIMDENFSGKLEVDEVNRLGVYIVGDDWDDETSRRFMEMADKDKSGGLSQDEFCQFCEEQIFNTPLDGDFCYVKKMINGYIDYVSRMNDCICEMWHVRALAVDKWCRRIIPPIYIILAFVIVMIDLDPDKK